MFWAFLNDHPRNPEVFIDATFGTWGVEEYTADHETFGARTGAGEGQSVLPLVPRTARSILPMSVRRQAAVGQCMARKEEARVDAVARGCVVMAVALPVRICAERSWNVQ